jgi:hypothetical protein
MHILLTNGEGNNNKVDAFNLVTKPFYEKWNFFGQLIIIVTHMGRKNGHFSRRKIYD